MTMEIEQRFIETPFEIETRADKAPMVRGLASPVYDGSDGTEYPLDNGVYERFSPDAFKDWLAKSPEIPLYLNHDSSQPLDFPKVWISKRGVEYSGELDESTRGKDAAILLNKKRIRGSSIGFIPEKITWQKDGSKHIRLIERAQLHEISMVYKPAYVNASVALRERNLWIEQEIFQEYIEKMKKIIESAI